MSDRALEVSTEWSLKREPTPISQSDARVMAEDWEGEAIDNGITPDELRAAAGGCVADCLIRPYGDAEIAGWPDVPAPGA